MAETLPLINIRALLTEREDMDAGVVSQVRSGLAESPKQFGALREAYESLQQKLDQGKGDAEKLKLKLGIAAYFLGRMDKSAEYLSSLKAPLAKFYAGRAMNELGQYQEALASLDSAAKAGYAPSEVSLHRVAALRGMGKLKEAHETLNAMDKFVQTQAEYQFQLALICLQEGKEIEAISHLEKAIEVDPRHVGALFNLAMFNDRHGNDEEAIALYQRCLNIPPARIGTLINLGILYEDREDYPKAVYCFEQVLRHFPNHQQARLYLKDAQASVRQRLDEDGDTGRRHHNAMLDIPVSDFELSVRSRNGLKRLNVRTLGDLVECTEQQLLALKNFGETSLNEVKNLLTAKSLRLGMKGESPRRHHPPLNKEDFSPQEQAMFDRPVSELNLSVRARKCMARLGITTIGELISHNPDELLECKNFGVTSLVEVKEKLAAINLKMRGE